MSFILTRSGKKFYPGDPKASDIDIVDIAHSLSHLCRFAGHTLDFYSVAQHSVLVSQIVFSKTKSHEKAMQGLLHDATEAYLVDMPSPVKHLPEMEPYRQMEGRLERMISMKFFGRISAFQLIDIKEADRYALAVEAKCLKFGAPTDDWASIKNIKLPKDTKLIPAKPLQAKLMFLEQYIFYKERM